VAAVDWLAWGVDSFARARAEDKPVLLSITAAWCQSCREMDRTTFADPDVAARINDGFVPIRVDADRRPDISERYDLGGWPTTAFLTPDGDPFGGGTYVSLGRMPSVLARVADVFRARRHELDASGSSRSAPRTAPPPDDLVSRDGDSADLLAIVFDSYDAENGGFGAEPKFPLTAPLELALDIYRDTRDSHMAHVVETTLDAIGWGSLHDEIDGGFFRCAATRDWQSPHREKLLDVNASLLRVYLDASEVLKITRYRECAVDILRYVQTWLADPVDGGWAGSQRADEDYYDATADARRDRTPPPVDAAFYAGWNASMFSSVLRAALMMDDQGLGEFALRSLERVLVACYSPGAGVAHYLDGRPNVRGLLDDQIAMASAQLDAYDATGNIVYEMMAQELAHYAVRTMWDERHGGFFDRSIPDEQEQVGLMKHRLKPFVTNCEAARLLRRLADVCGEPDFATRADATLAAMAALAPGQGPLAAHYVLAMRPVAPRE